MTSVMGGGGVYGEGGKPRHMIRMCVWGGGGGRGAGVNPGTLLCLSNVDSAG